MGCARPQPAGITNDLSAAPREEQTRPGQRRLLFSEKADDKGYCIDSLCSLTTRHHRMKMRRAFPRFLQLGYICLSTEIISIK